MAEATDTKPRCDACQFYVRFEGSFNGRCQRFPPIPYSSMHSAFPEVSQSQWCGEFKKREEKEPVPEMPAKGRRAK